MSKSRGYMNKYSLNFASAIDIFMYIMHSQIFPLHSAHFKNIPARLCWRSNAATSCFPISTRCRPASTKANDPSANTAWPGNRAITRTYNRKNTTLFPLHRRKERICNPSSSFTGWISMPPAHNTTARQTIRLSYSSG